MNMILLSGTHVVMYSWQKILSELLLRADPQYKITGMYIEYDNVADPLDEVTPPTLSRDRTIDYYTELSLHPSRDFLRVSLLGTNSETVDDVTNLTFVGGTSGSEGVHGKPFSSAANSKVFGAALVARPVAADRFQDVLFCAAYFDVTQQQLKQASDVGLAWKIALA
jgi:hypothetical protein